MDFNKVIIVGRVSQAPELRSTSSGQSVASMGVATNRRWTDKAGNKHEEAQFHSVVIWGKLAETSDAFLQKGMEVLVEGRLETRSWEDKQGVMRKTTEIIAENIQFGSRQAQAAPPQTAPALTSAPTAQPGTPRRETAPARSAPAVSLDGGEEDTGRSMDTLFGDAKVGEDGDVPF